VARARGTPRPGRPSVLFDGTDIQGSQDPDGPTSASGASSVMEERSLSAAAWSRENRGCGRGDRLKSEGPEQELA
jgi:hypothetical protein